MQKGENKFGEVIFLVDFTFFYAWVPCGKTAKTLKRNFTNFHQWDFLGLLVCY